MRQPLRAGGSRGRTRRRAGRPVLEQHDPPVEDLGLLEFEALQLSLPEDALTPGAPAGQWEDHEAQSVHRPAATRLRTSERLPIVRSGTRLSRLIAGSASIASPATRRVFAHSSGSDSVDDTTTFGTAVSRWDAGSDALDEMVASAS
jgi:hypothetical protein